jgi:hypothetical protein
MLSPTSCNPMRITGTLGAVDGQTSAVASRFQVGDCQALPFAPKLAINLTDKTQTTDGGHPGVDATATQAPGEAGIKQVKVTLPLSTVLDPDNAQALCEYEDGLRLDCPDTSIVGNATAVSPLLNEPLTGPVYFVKNVRFNAKGQPIRTLPTLLVKLVGENGVRINLRATSNVDSKDRLVNTFSDVPDAPVSSFKLHIDGGKHGIIVVTHDADVCKGAQVANAETDAQSGKTHDFAFTLSTPCAQLSKLGKAKAGKHGVVTLPVTVPGPGTLKAGGGKSGLKLVTRKVSKRGTVKLTLRPTAATLKKLAKRKSHTLKVSLPTSFVAGGEKFVDRKAISVTLKR